MSKNKIEFFFNTLLSFPTSSTVTNQFQNPIPLHNLKAYIDLKLKTAKYMLVGEGAGYHGCRQSGIAFTDGYTLGSHRCYTPYRSQFLYSDIYSFKEMSTSIVHSAIEPIPNAFDEIFLWNAFPFHPHYPNEPTKNRKPTNSERKFGLQFITMLNDIFEFDEIHPIGRVSEQCITELMEQNKIDVYPFTTFRHPAFGGATEFRNQMNELYNVQKQKELDLFSFLK